jgi:hypothetical protein
LRDGKRRQDLGRRAYEQMDKLWNPEVAAKRVIELYEAVSEGRDTPFDDGPLSKAGIIKNNWFRE